jgi:hypothetical protein
VTRHHLLALDPGDQDVAGNVQTLIDTAGLPSWNELPGPTGLDFLAFLVSPAGLNSRWWEKIAPSQYTSNNTSASPA